MPPVDFNPNAKSLEVKQRSGVDKDNVNKGSTTPADDAVSGGTGNASDDRFTQSPELAALKNVDFEPSAQEQQARAEKIASIKQQIADGSYPILSADKSVREEAALAVSEKLVDFESQMTGLGE